MNQQPVKKGQLSKISLENLKEGKSNSPIGLSKIIKETFGVPETQEPGLKIDFKPGESIEFNHLNSKNKEGTKKPLFQENLVILEEESEREAKIFELRKELTGIIEEIKFLTKSTDNLKEEVKTIPIQIPEKPGVYHLFFFTEVLNIIKNARMEVEKASVWLASFQDRNDKKYWARYKKYGSSFLLSADHYLSRSAG